MFFFPMIVLHIHLYIYFILGSFEFIVYIVAPQNRQVFQTTIFPWTLTLWVEKSLQNQVGTNPRAAAPLTWLVDMKHPRVVPPGG